MLRAFSPFLVPVRCQRRDICKVKTAPSQGCFTKLRRWDGENKESAQGNEKADKLLRWQKSVKYPLQRPLFKKSVQRWDTFKYILSQKILVPIQQIHDLCVWQSNSFQYRHKSNDVVGKLPNQREVVSRSFGW